MSSSKKTTIFGFLGTNLDSHWGPERWEKWRPSVDLFRQESLLIDRYELLYEEQYSKLAEQVMNDIRQQSPETEVAGRILGITKPWDFEDVFSHLHEFLSNYSFSLQNHNYYVNITTGTHVAQICLFLLTESRHLPGSLLQISPPKGRGRGGKKGHGTYSIIDLDLSKYDLLATRFAKEKEEAQDFLKSGIATKNPAFNQLIEEIETVALRSSAPILITGPTGAGKSQLASRIFELRQTRCGVAGEFVEVNCATLRGDMAMSTLFGHKKGSFTGAQADRKGLLREAHEGVLFLDEIGELGLDEQAMLLRAIEEGKWLPMGSDAPVKSKFQLIAGTNKDLRNEMVQGTFREDLLARINLWTFQLPGLADRREDIAPNIDYELAHHTQSSGQAISFNKEARQIFLKFAEAGDTPWHGNFRDLNAAITRMATLAPRGRIRHEEVRAEQQRLQDNWHRPEHGPQHRFELEAFLTAKQVEGIDPFDRPQLAHVIETCQKSSSISEAGRKLFAVSRIKRKSTNDGDRLRKYLAKFDLTFDQFQP